MSESFHKTFTLKDGTVVQVEQSNENCYAFHLLSTDGTDDRFTWDASEARDVQGFYGLSDMERRRNLALQELWKEL